jgi:dTDP-4-dehydrorhamnose reductase
MAGVRVYQADLTCPSEAEKLFTTIRPQAVIHAAAVSQPALCERNPDTSKAVNVEVPEHLATLCAQLEVPFVLTSTDLVFDGLSAPYEENDAVSPICVYGRQITINALSLSVARSPDCSLKSDAAYALGYDPVSLSRAVKQVADQ